jgi:hypothetical protein
VRTAFSFIIALFACLALNQGAVAQVNERFADMNAEIELMRSVAQTERKALVEQAMHLTAEESTAFWPVYNTYRAEIVKVSDQLVKLVTDYAALRDTLTDAQARTLLTDYLAFEQALLTVRKKYVKRFSKVLPMVKVMRFYQVENKLDLLQRLGAASQIPLAR